MMTKRAVLCACACLVVLAFCGNPANAQIAKVVDDSGRRFFINAEPPVQTKLMPAKSHAAIYMPAEATFTGRGRPLSASTAMVRNAWCAKRRSGTTSTRRWFAR